MNDDFSDMLYNAWKAFDRIAKIQNLEEADLMPSEVEFAKKMALEFKKFLWENS